MFIIVLILSFHWCNTVARSKWTNRLSHRSSQKERGGGVLPHRRRGEGAYSLIGGEGGVLLHRRRGEAYSLIGGEGGAYSLIGGEGVGVLPHRRRGEGTYFLIGGEGRGRTPT